MEKGKGSAGGKRWWTNSAVTKRTGKTHNALPERKTNTGRRVTDSPSIFRYRGSELLGRCHIQGDLSLPNPNSGHRKSVGSVGIGRGMLGNSQSGYEDDPGSSSSTDPDGIAAHARNTHDGMKSLMRSVLAVTIVGQIIILATGKAEQKDRVNDMSAIPSPLGDPRSELGRPALEMAILNKFEEEEARDGRGENKDKP
ncbi:hypothetical protein RRG08_051647 [Elysia crispata]|uniref:Uncharacterized protein n=1 Tax=Elysia crispata TaxID=231223 RepID=A0AAE1A2R2_9GAST|nr:hypothetical protein RRG08_051647 [Elysia crispata]